MFKRLHIFRAAGDHAPGSGDRGIALLLVLWIITFLAVICAEFSWTMRTEIATARNFKEGEQAYYTAEAGINRAIIELMRTASRPPQATAAPEDAQELEEKEQPYWEPGSSYRFELDENPCSVEIEDQGNKLEINTYLAKAANNPASLKAFLKKTVGLEGEELDVVADSMIDWHDKDNNITGVNGAEDDYYKSLDPPYASRNGDIPVLEELLLVKGIDESIYYGPQRAAEQEQKIKLTAEELQDILAGKQQVEEPPEDDEDNATNKIVGLQDIFFAAYPELLSAARYNENVSTIKIDINTATVTQLMLLDGMNMATAQKIVEERQDSRFTSTADPRLAGLRLYEVWKNQITVKGSKSQGFYKIKATGFSPDGRVSRTIMCSTIIQKNWYYITTWKALN